VEGWQALSQHYLHLLSLGAQAWLLNCSRSAMNFPSYHLPHGILSIAMDA
jgi:hypothetical protein